MKKVLMFWIFICILGIVLVILGIIVANNNPLFDEGHYEIVVGEITGLPDEVSNEITYGFITKSGEKEEGVAPFSTDLNYIGEPVTIRYLKANPAKNQINMLSYFGNGVISFYIFGTIIFFIGFGGVVAIKTMKFIEKM